MKPKKSRREIAMTVAIRQQTASEQRRFDADLEFLLTEMVRREIAGRREYHNGQKEINR